MAAHISQKLADGWAVSFAKKQLVCYNTREIRSQPSYQGAVQHLVLNFSVDELVHKYIAFGLTPSLLQTSEINGHNACVIQVGQPSAGLRIIPMCITHLNKNVRLFYQTSLSVVPKGTFAFALIFVKPVSANEMALFVSLNQMDPSEDNGGQLEIDPTGCLCRISGIAQKRGASFELHFNGEFKRHLTMHYINTAVADSMTNHPVAHARDPLYPGPILPKYVYLETSLDGHHNKMTFEPHGSIPTVNQLQVEALFSINVTPAITFLHHMGWFCGHSGAFLVPFYYTKDDRHLNPGECFKFEILTKFCDYKKNNNPLAVFIMGVNANDDWVVESSVWFSVSPLILHIRTTNRSTVLLRNSLLAVGIILHYETNKDHRATNLPRGAVFYEDGPSLTWKDAVVRRTVDASPIFLWDHHTNTIDLGNPEDMVY